MKPKPLADDDLTIKVSEMLVASADDSDALIDGSVEEVLHTLRERLQLDVVFVAEFVEGQRVFRFVDGARGAPQIQPGTGHDLEATFCMRVVDGRLPEFIADVAALGPQPGVPPLPFRIGTHLSTPVVLKDGSTYGTLCCFSLAPSPLVQKRDVETLRHCAKLVAFKLDAALAKGLADPPPTRMRESPAPYASGIWKLHSAWDLSTDARRDWLEST